MRPPTFDLRKTKNYTDAVCFKCVFSLRLLDFEQLHRQQQVFDLAPEVFQLSVWLLGLQPGFAALRGNGVHAGGRRGGRFGLGGLAELRRLAVDGRLCG